MHRRDERGASLIMVLFVVGFLALLIPALLGLTFTGAATTSSVKVDRRAQYAAASALDGAIQHGRDTEWVGRFGLDCPTMNLTIDSRIVAVSCSSSTGAFELDRTVAFQATVEGTTMATASVIYRDGTAGGLEPDVEVVSWDSNLVD